MPSNNNTQVNINDPLISKQVQRGANSLLPRATLSSAPTTFACTGMSGRKVFTGECPGGFARTGRVINDGGVTGQFVNTTQLIYLNIGGK